MNTVSIHDIGVAADWEKKANGATNLQPGTNYYFAEIIVNGRHETMYFDATDEEVANMETLRSWVIKQCQKTHEVKDMLSILP